MKTIISTLILTITFLHSTAQNIPEFIEVTGGTFTMGNKDGAKGSDEVPTHKITLSDFSIGKTEITVAQYRYYCNETGVEMPKEPNWGWNDNSPIINVSWDEAVNYCDWLSEKLKGKITLPTEAQWEYAARGGNKSKGYNYSGGNKMKNVGWFIENSNDKTQPVATKKPNELGIYDMSGNVWEWCLDWYKKEYYAKSTTIDPLNIISADYKVLRGGSWYNDASYCHVANRSSNEPKYRHGYNLTGFRVVSIKL
ncbi:formylglycine-generating enzyme family protein [Pseudotamlana carrageenivorans]|uniref:Sulfatase-modifying factor enzyme-like domain-containing protein n=1 Tax=Pseudotamlana carrageenivorans TaxID=2069432 RepID=A0A2I7SE29_9FLAO|nr:formylglycine-generating enzyme family protein [Tamlana carrageenivorans]AUS04155.1 hypothetical protein C1A40_01075 [Tamlana carrageenivorans]